MQLKKLKIKNYKRLLDVDLSLEKDVTLIAGPNNSGKTSIVEIIKFIFTDNKEKIEISELNTSLLNEWINDFYIKYEEILKKQKMNFELIEELTSFFIKNPLNTEKILPIINVEISYDKENDNLTDIIKYTFELNEVNSIYFKYSCEINLNLFNKYLIENNKKINNRYTNKEINGNQKESSIKKILKNILQNSIEEKFSFTNSEYLEESLITKKEFKSLFNVKTIHALRKLDDNKNDTNYSLSKSMVDIAASKDVFIGKLDDISDTLSQKLEETEVEKVILKESISKFNSTLKETSGGKDFAKIELSINPESSDINALLRNTATAQYNVNELKFGEYSQGLGYSNMVYMHMHQQIFEDSIQNSKINIMMIEEPESHMHPQMQYSFFRKIMSYYKDNSPQCIISTHSTEIINNIEEISKIRVIRSADNSFSSKIYDLGIFVKMIENKKYDETTNKIDFYNFFFTVGFPNIIFSNKIVLFEGDSERIFLKYIVKSKFSKLYSDYVSYIQVGGAYAKNYFDIVKFLNIKTLVLTDIDYDKEKVELDDILKSKSTNATINYSYKDLANLLSKQHIQVEEYDEDSADKNPTIENIYKCRIEDNNNLIGVFTQKELDNYSRTLEEAMLTKFLNIKVWDTKDKASWAKIRKENSLKFSIPKNDKEYTVREIVNSSSQNKTDFMYSVVLSSKHLEMIPNYIEKGLEWLQDGE